jgi:hypothetical protein
MSWAAYPPSDAQIGEKQMLLSWLDFQRVQILRKIEGLSDDDARRAMVPSGVSLLGIVQHLGYVERWWFSVCFANEMQPAFSDDDPDGDWRLAADATIQTVTEFYLQRCARSREIAGAAALDDVSAFEGSAYSMRWILVHMIEETARHAGHADILREQLDGVTGM